MIERYNVKEIEDIWSTENKLNNWLKVETAVYYAWYKENIIDQFTYNKFKNLNLKIDIKKMNFYENKTKHDVVAFITMITEQITDPIVAKWFHFGLTSSDIVDTAQNLQFKFSNNLVKETLNNLRNELLIKSNKYKDCLIMGRSHGIDGEPISLGWKFRTWSAEINRQIDRFNHAKKYIEVSKLSGSMGNFVHIWPETSKIASKVLKLKPSLLNNQILQRDNHYDLINVIANISTSFEKIALQLRLFSQSSISEINEGFNQYQKGSSSMPHKKNPIGLENICGLSRMIRTYTSCVAQNNLLWFERDISHSSNERVIFPDIYHLIIYCGRRLINIIKNLNINLKKIENNIKSAHNVYFSQLIMNYLIINNNETREKIYEIIQKCGLNSLLSKKDFYQSLLENNITNYISLEKLTELFNNKHFLRNIDNLYKLKII